MTTAFPASDTATRRHVLSKVTGACVFISSVLLGIYMPVVVRIWRDFGVQDREFDWPHRVLPYLHWAWTVPVGITLGALVLRKDRFLRSSTATSINIIALFGLVAVLILCWWGAVLHRMIQWIHPTQALANP
jgi:hypothetical protein